ncbi:endo-1,4-beta-xylanase [Pelagicoccus enzymogenes]|nr:endo-1,4-beta-xylanase [Pelagicoccus enzymogenes]
MTRMSKTRTARTYLSTRLRRSSFLFVLLLAVDLHAQTRATIVEAESGTLGNQMVQTTVDGVTGIAPSTDLINSGNPGSTARTASYSVTFPNAGNYWLYARVHVGSGGASDDSFFYGNGFGSKSPTTNGDWIQVNNIASGVGRTAAGEVLDGQGGAGSQVWKWINLTLLNSGTPFTVPDGALTQTFALGARENGLTIDKFAFGPSIYDYTVGNLDNDEPGSTSSRQPDIEDVPYDPTGLPLATGKAKFLGSVYSGSQIANFEHYFNQVTPENAGKWGSVEGTRDQMNWTGLDNAYNFAKDNGYKFRFHVLTWGAQQPNWINDLSPTEQREEIEEWIQAVATRYPDIDYVEVTNEPLNQRPDGGDTGVVSGRANYIDALGGTGETGWDWLLESFRIAREAFGPDTPLMINEYGIIGNPSAVDNYLGIIDLLIAEDLIDVIGFQGHAFSTRGPSAALMTQTLDTLASRGLPLMATELDIDGSSDTIQLAEYQRVFPVIWEHPAMLGITLWGYRPGLWRDDQRAYLVLGQGAERPAMTWLREYIAESSVLSFGNYLAQRLLDPAEHGIADDFDKDGLPTGIEYLLGLDPTKPDAEQPWSWPDGLPRLQLTLSADADEGRLEIQRSPDLSTWTTVGSYDLQLREADGVTVDTNGAAPVLTFAGPPGGSSHSSEFYRFVFVRDSD